MASNDLLSASSNLLGKARHLVKYLKSDEAIVEGEDLEELQHIIEKCIALCRATSGGNASVITTLDQITERRCASLSSPNGDAVEQPVKPRHYRSKRLLKSNPLREGGFSNNGVDEESERRAMPTAEEGTSASCEKRRRRRKDYASEGGVTLRMRDGASFGVEKMKLRRKRKNFNPNSPLSRGLKIGHRPREDE